MPAAAAQLGPLPWRVNCGDNNGQATGQPGWLLLSETAAPPGLSLAPPAVDTVHVAQAAPGGSVPVPSDVHTLDPDQLADTHLLTALQLADDTVLTLAGLPASKPFRVRLELGAAGPWVDVAPGIVWGPDTVSREVRVEEQTPETTQWRTLLQDLRCTTGYKAATMSSSLGGIVPVWCRVHSDASGVVKLRFSTDGADPLFLAGFEVHAFEALPVQYKHSETGALQSSQPALAAFVAAFNAHAYDAAEEAALALADPWFRGSALCQLVGWLDGSRDGRFHLMNEARAALLVAQGPHPGAGWLLDQLDQLQRALDHLDARGYSSAQACPEQGGQGFLNPDCAGQMKFDFGEAYTNANAHIALRLLSGLCAPATGDTVLADIKAWNAGTGGTAGWEPSPFVFAALKTYGTTIAAMNPQLSVSTADPESVEMLDRFRDIFLTGFLDPAFDVGDFPKDVELLLFQRYAQLGTHPYQWDLATVKAVLTDEQIDASWWGPQVADLPDVPNMPPWANIQRDAVAAYRNAVAYWLEERLIEGELGGGLGDDVELMLLLFPAFAGQQDQGSRRMLDALDAMVRHAFEASDQIVDGYYAGPMTDSEHSGEYTTNVGQALRGAFGNTRRYLLNGFAVGEHLLAGGDTGAAWADESVLGRLHLKSSHFTTEGPDDNPANAFDLPISGRALFPTVSLGAHAPLASGHPLQVVLRDWAEGWRDDALSTAGNKPAGFFGPVQWPSNAFGVAGAWWTDNTSFLGTDVLSKSQATYTLELMRVAYQTSTAADRWSFLLPAVRMFRAAQLWEDKGQPSASEGSQDWAAGLFRNGPRFHALVISHLQAFAEDGDLTSTDDPSLPGSTPYVDAVLLARMHQWAEGAQGLSGANLAMAYALAPTLPCGPGVTVKSQSSAEYSYSGAWPFYRAVYPLLTKHVMHTDRVFLNRNQLMSHIVAGHTGGNLMEGVPQRPALRWVGHVGEPLDLAISVNGRAWDDTWVSAFAANFQAETVALDLWLDEGLLPGRYRIDVGPATPKCDMFGAGALYTTSFADKRGTGVAVPIELAYGNNLVRVVRDGAATAPAGRWDLALDPPEIEIQKTTGKADLVLRARVANVGAEASPPGTVAFSASLSLPDGKSLSLEVGEHDVGSAPLPSLPASTGWQPSETVVEIKVPVNELVGTVLVTGLGVQLRASVNAGPDDWDLLNNSLSRMWIPEEMPKLFVDL